jgi:Arylsulfotransferase (ASST)
MRRRKSKASPGGEVVACRETSGLTRAEFVKRAVGGGAGLLLGGGAAGAYGLVAAPDANAAAAPGGVQVFKSEPKLRPPQITILRRPPVDRTESYIFIAPSSGPGQRGALIFDDDGEVVWFHPSTPKTTMNFRTALYKEQPVLTWWEGKSSNGLGVGEYVIFDNSYREIARFEAGDHRIADLHEFLITGHNTALVTSYETRIADLSGVGGPTSAPVVGGIVQEIEIPSARVLFEWKSLDHVPIEETHAIMNSGAFDYFHLNSIDIDGDGNLLVSARNTWAVYKIGRKTGEVIWRLGGKKSDFTMGKGTTFAWQHDARHHKGGTQITVFDDGGAPTVQPQSRALLISLDTNRRTATLVQDYSHHPGRLTAHFMGNAQALDNGDVVVGWGSEPYITEFAPGGGIRFEAKLPHGGQNYRAFRLPWTGHPSARPKLALRRSGGIIYAYASWNGATEVASWRLLAGNTPTRLTAAATKPKTGFETTLTLVQGYRYFAVAALDRHGEELGRSIALRP